DHNDISDWGEAAVKLTTPFRDTHESAVDCSVLPGDPPTLHNVRIARNFLHHNERDTGGYGVSVGRAFIEGNVFVSNRHAITAGWELHNEYRASYNLVLSNAPEYTDHCFGVCVPFLGCEDWCYYYHNQDFDMHGSDNPGHWFGGVGG